MTNPMSSRRDGLPFDPYFFEKQARRGVTYSLEDAFGHIYRANHWSGPDSVSGEGASRTQTRRVERALPRLLEALDVDVLLDLPCGDFGWMRFVALPVSRYIGADVVPALIDANRRRYADARHHFAVLDLTADALPQADLLLCRDGLVHLSFADIRRALANIRRSRIRHLLATTFPACEANEDIVTGDWRVLNLQQTPFHFPEPLRLINEGCTEGAGRYADKSLGLWRVEALPEP